MVNHGLTDHQLTIIKSILAPFANHITHVDLFGSRAKGTFRPNSDIDLVLHGNVDDALIDRLWTLFSESSLPLKVDVKHYDPAMYAPLKAHMDAVCQPFLTQQELLATTAQRMEG